MPSKIKYIVLLILIMLLAACKPAPEVEAPTSADSQAETSFPNFTPTPATHMSSPADADRIAAGEPKRSSNAWRILGPTPRTSERYKWLRVCEFTSLRIVDMFTCPSACHAVNHVYKD